MISSVGKRNNSDIVFSNRILYLKVKYKILDLDFVFRFGKRFGKMIWKKISDFALVFCVGFFIKILCSDFLFRFFIQILCSDFLFRFFFRFCVQIKK